MKDLIELLLSLLEVEGTRWVDMDKQQIDIYETKPSIPMPATLFKVALPVCDTQDRFTQIVQATLTLRYAEDLSVSETSARASQDARDRSLAYWDRIDRTHKVLQGYTDDMIESIDRVNCVPEDRKDGLNVVRAVYNVVFEDQADN